MKKLINKFYLIFLFALAINTAFAQNTDTNYVVSEPKVTQTTDSNLIVGYDEITKVVDGDTFRFKHLDKSTRLLCIDTEETFKGKNAESKTDEIRDWWLQFYNQEKQAKNTTHPIKLDSPFGYETGEWAKEFVKDASRVRIEKDDTLRSIDMFDRYLVYIFVEKNGVWINYNLECVRTGHSPYFNKYGNSARFHQEFVDAQRYAQENKLGIWDPKSLCYPDYDQRITWWNERAKQLEWFYEKYGNDENVVNLLNSDAENRLTQNLGKEITTFGSIGEILTDRFPYLMRTSISKGVTFDIVVEEKNKEVFKSLDFDKLNGYYFYCSGKLYGKEGRYKIELTNKEQIKFE